MVAILLIVAWTLWFFLAGLTLHETGQLSRVTSSGAVVAAFPVEVADRIRSGQPATFRLQGTEPGPLLPAMVTKVGKPGDAKHFEVEPYPKSRLAFTSLALATSRHGDHTIMGQAAIEIARVAPATLLMHTLAASRDANATPRPSAR
jgi:hypothetical protein